jgi:hypothetical protein
MAVAKRRQRGTADESGPDCSGCVGATLLRSRRKARGRHATPSMAYRRVADDENFGPAGDPQVRSHPYATSRIGLNPKPSRRRRGGNPGRPHNCARCDPLTFNIGPTRVYRFYLATRQHFHAESCERALSGSAIVKNGELPPAVGGANPDARLLAPRCPRHNARRCCSINRDRARSGGLGGHACSFLPLMRDRRSRQQMATYFDGVMAPLRGSSRSNLPTFIRAALFDDPCRISIGVAQNCLWQERSLCCVGGWARERPKTTASVHLYRQRMRTL